MVFNTHRCQIVGIIGQSFGVGNYLNEHYALVEAESSLLLACKTWRVRADYICTHTQTHVISSVMLLSKIHLIFLLLWNPTLTIFALQILNFIIA